MTVFSESERIRQGPPKAGESMFSYLNTSARPEARACRDTIERWVEDYPKDKLDHWLGDFRSNDDGQFESAFFELFLIEFFKANAWKVLAVEPELDGVRGNPDFLIVSPDGRRVVVEAISPNNRSEQQRGKEKLIADIKDAINAVKIADYYLILDAIEAPTQSINKAKLIRALGEWLETKPTDNATFQYRDRGALVDIKVIHRPGRKVDAADYRAIGIEMGGLTVSTPGAEVKRGLERKSSKYRDLEMPYLIALNARGFHDTEDDYLAATYGSLAVRFTIGPDGSGKDPETIRENDGLFNDGGRARKKNVSAVLLFNGVAPWNWRDRRSCIIHNAYADRPLGDVTFGGDAFLPKDGVLKRIEGSGVSDLFK
jgi:hypothetical protein